MTYHTRDDSNASNNRRSRSCGDARRRAQRRKSGRKERVLHTRVSEQLSDDIRRFAEDLRVPASNLVRNVLEEVFTVVDGVTDDVGDLFDDLLTEAEEVRDRVRNQTRPNFRHRTHRRRGRRGQTEDVENEFRRDEAAEARFSTRSDADPDAQRSQSESDASSDSESSAGSAPNVADLGANRDSDRATAPAADELFPDVLGWQPLVLNRDFECGRCRDALRAGESAFLGLTAAGLTEIALCGRCAGRH